MPQRGDSLRVVTWNIRAAIGPGEPFPPGWWRHVRPDRLASIASFLRELDADVVTLQEVTLMTVDGVVTDQAAELAALIDRSARYGAVHAYPLVEPETARAVGSAMWGNAILTRKPLADAFVRGLPRADDHDLIEPAGAEHPLAGVPYGHADPGHRELRCVVGGTLRDGAIDVATTHLTYVGREQRRRQAAAARAALDGATDGATDAASDGSDRPLIVTGDFNAAIDARELEVARAGLVDAFRAVGIAPGDDRRRSCGELMIDHVLVRGFDVTSCRVATEAGDRSDHWPVVVDLARG